jgi:DNA-binding transcriptional LysR family regulator
MKSNMKYREMLLLWEVSRTGSVTAAAERVRISQPAASALLRQLEERLGFALFDRARRRLAFTAKGAALLPEIANALTALDTVNRLAETMKSDAVPRIAIGSVASVAGTILPLALADFVEYIGRPVVTVRTGMSLEIAGLVADERVDFGIVIGENIGDTASSRRVADLSLCCVVPPGHPFASRRSVSVDEIAAERYVSLGRQFTVGSAIAQAIEASGHGYNPAVEVMQFSAACAFVEAGFGIALLDSMSNVYAAKLGLVAVAIDAEVELAMGLLWSRTTSLGAHAAQFTRALCKAYKTSRAAGMPGVAVAVEVG